VPMRNLFRTVVCAMVPRNRPAEASVRLITRRRAARKDTANSSWHSPIVASDRGRLARNGPKRAAGMVRAAAPTLHRSSSSALAAAAAQISLKKVRTISCGALPADYVPAADLWHMCSVSALAPND